MANLHQPFLDHLGDKMKQVLCALRFCHVILFDQRVKHLLKRLMLLEKVPDPRPYRVQAEVHSRTEVKDNLLSLEIAGKDVIADSHARCEHQFLPHSRKAPLTLRGFELINRVSLPPLSVKRAVMPRNSD
jgi:hypothetical protein